MARPVRREDPPPLETNDVRAVAIGTAVWAALLLGLLPFSARLAAAGHAWWLWTCVVGILLGLVGMAHCRRRRQSIARDRPEPALREPLP